MIKNSTSNIIFIAAVELMKENQVKETKHG